MVVECLPPEARSCLQLSPDVRINYNASNRLHDAARLRLTARHTLYGEILPRTLTTLLISQRLQHLYIDSQSYSMNFCGLDFGTSNSTVGVIKNTDEVMVPLEKDSSGHWQTTLPSAMFFDFDSDRISFGRSAITQYTDGQAGRLMRSMKSLLGSSYMGDKTQVKNRFYTYDEIVGFFIGSLKTQAETFLQPETADLNAVVVGRPVYFNDDDADLDNAAEEHLADIARLAGFREVSFQYEPIAAALDYESLVRSEELALIVDIGGGTSDFTLIRLSPERHLQSERKSDFLGNHGIHLGGTDFDRRLSMTGVMPQFGLGTPMKERPELSMPSNYYFELATWHRIHLLYERGVLLELETLRQQVKNQTLIDRLTGLLKRRKGHHLAALVEQAKIDLSASKHTTVKLRSLFNDDTHSAAADPDILNCELTQQQLQQSLQRDVASIFDALDTTLKQAGLSPEQIDTVFTTGGSTALPMVKACISDAFPDARLVGGDLYNSVGSGLLKEARKRYQ